MVLCVETALTVVLTVHVLLALPDLTATIVFGRHGG